MAERRETLDGAALERALSALGAEIAYPAAPRLQARVVARIAAGPPRRRVLPPRLQPWQWAAAAAVAALLLATVVLGVAPGARKAVADRFGLEGVRFFAVPERPAAEPATATPARTESGQPMPAVGAALFQGRPVTLDEARGRVGFPIRLPNAGGLEGPDAVYAGTSPSSQEVWLAYAPRPGLPEVRETGVGLLIAEFRGTFLPFLGKGLSQGSILEVVTVHGGPAYWVTGEPHVLLYRDRSGTVHEERSRLAGNTLLWERDGVTYRLESALGRDEAIRIAESIR